MQNNMVVLYVNREGYDPEQIRDTMSVGELIKCLEQFDEDDKIYVAHDGGYTFGGITKRQFEEE